MSHPAGGHGTILTRANLPNPPLVACQGIIPSVPGSGNRTAGPKPLRRTETLLTPLSTITTNTYACKRACGLTPDPKQERE